MAANTLPIKLDDLFTLAEDMADGAALHGAAIGLLQNTEARIRADLLAARNAELTYAEKKALKVTRTAAQTVIDSNGRAYIAAASNVLSFHLGTGWSTAWEPTGFPNQSTGIPSQITARQALLQALNTYFTAHAAHENAGLLVTAARALALFTDLSDARSAVNAAVTEAGQARAARDAAVRTLRKRMRGLIDELGQLLEDDDPRWFAFGLVPPAGSDLPPAPENLILTAGGPGSVLADWSDTPRAVRYRVEIQVVTVDPDFHLDQTVTESDATITSAPPGSTLNVRIVAVNADDETGPPSDVIQILVPVGP
jgi:hypothetical protein